MQYYNPAIPGCIISYGMVAKHVNKKNADILMLFYTHLLLFLRPLVLLLSIVTFNNDKSHRQSEFCANLMYVDIDPG